MIAEGNWTTPSREECSFLGRPLGLSGFWFQDRPLAQFLRTAESSGITSVGLWPGHFGASNADEIRTASEATGVAIYCLNASSEPRLNSPSVHEVKLAQQQITTTISLAHKLKIPLVQTYAGTRNDMPVSLMLEAYSEQLRPCVEYAAALGVTLTVENNLDRRGEDLAGLNPSRSPDRLRQIAEAIASPGFGVTFDPCNFLITGFEPFPQAYEALKQWIVSVELKDAIPLHEVATSEGDTTILSDSLCGDYRVVPLGQGILDLRGLLSALSRNAYTGHVVLDPFAGGGDLVRQVQGGTDFIKALASRTDK